VEGNFSPFVKKKCKNDKKSKQNVFYVFFSFIFARKKE